MMATVVDYQVESIPEPEMRGRSSADVKNHPNLGNIWPAFPVLVDDFNFVFQCLPLYFAAKQSRRDTHDARAFAACAGNDFLAQYLRLPRGTLCQRRHGLA